jgi:hypothetical protein
MKPVVTRFVLTVVLFLAWLGFLTYQVWTRPLTPTGQPLVLSRPQILTSEVDVVADLPEKPGKTLTVKEVLYGKGIEPGQEITVRNLPECQPLVPGEYLLPLNRAGNDDFVIAPVPPSPGYRADGLPRIYPASPEARAQYHTIAKPASALSP